MATTDQQPRFASSTTAENIWNTADSNLSKGLQPQIDRNARIRARQNRMSMPVAPANFNVLADAPSLPKREKSVRQRPASIRVEGRVDAAGLSRQPSIRSAKRQSFGPLLPVIVDGVSPMASQRSSLQKTPVMAEFPSEVKAGDDEV